MFGLKRYLGDSIPVGKMGGVTDIKEVCKIISHIVENEPTEKILMEIISYARDYLVFDECMIYEWSGNKLRLLHADTKHQSLMQFRQKQIFKNKVSFLLDNDIIPKDDSQTLYHPVKVDDSLRYIVIYDCIDIEEHEENFKEYVMYCKDLSLLLGCLYNRRRADQARFLDSLTSLSNELQLRKDIRFCKKNNKAYILAVVDIDDIANLNTKYGVECTDHVIKEVAKMAEKMARKGDAAYRFFGARIALLLSGNYNNCIDNLKSLNEELNQHTFTYEKKTEIKIKSTIGAVELQFIEEKKEEDIVNTAYQNIFRTLKAGKGGVCVYGEQKEVEYVEPEEEPNEEQVEKTTKSKTKKTKETKLKVENEEKGTNKAVKKREAKENKGFKNMSIESLFGEQPVNDNCVNEEKEDIKEVSEDITNKAEMQTEPLEHHKEDEKEEIVEETKEDDENVLLSNDTTMEEEKEAGKDRIEENEQETASISEECENTANERKMGYSDEMLASVMSDEIIPEFVEDEYYVEEMESGNSMVQMNEETEPQTEYGNEDKIKNQPEQTKDTENAREDSENDNIISEDKREQEKNLGDLLIKEVSQKIGRSKKKKKKQSPTIEIFDIINS